MQSVEYCDSQIASSWYLHLIAHMNTKDKQKPSLNLLVYTSPPKSKID
jgi:hypothetical protein